MNERKNNKQQYKQYEKLIKNWFNEQFTAPNGLTLCYPNTGSGKSYQSYLSIAKNLYAYITGEKTSDMTDEEYNARTRRILYVTPNLNNLPLLNLCKPNQSDSFEKRLIEVIEKEKKCSVEVAKKIAKKWIGEHCTRVESQFDVCKRAFDQIYNQSRDVYIDQIKSLEGQEEDIEKAYERCKAVYSIYDKLQKVGGSLENYKAEVQQAYRDIRRSLRNAMMRKASTALKRNKRNSKKSITKTEIRAKAVELLKKERDKEKKDYKGISFIDAFFPYIDLADKHFIAMSVSKLLYAYSDVIANHDFIYSGFIDDAVIFIDEIDKSKEFIANELVRSASDNSLRVFAMMQDIVTVLSDCHSKEEMYHKLGMTSAIREAIETNDENPRGNDEFKTDAILHEAKELSKLHMNGTFKLVPSKDDPDMQQRYLYSSTINQYTYASEISNQQGSKNVKQLFGKYDSKNHRTSFVVVQGLDQIAQHEKNAEYINIAQLIEMTQLFARHFVGYVKNVASIYHKNQTHFSAMDKSVHTIDIGASIQTVLANFSKHDNDEYYHVLFESTEQQYGNAANDKTKKKKEVRLEDLQLPPYGIHAHGFRLTKLSDSDTNNENTDFSIYELKKTPERVLMDIASRSTVIGLSATANHDSVISNYDQKELKSVLGAHFSEAPKDVLKAMVTLQCKDLPQFEVITSSEKVSKTSKDHVQLYLHSGDYYEERDSLVFRNAFIDNVTCYLPHSKEIRLTKIADKLWKYVENNSSDDYIRTRYLNTVMSIAIFLADPHAHAAIDFQQPTLAEGKEGWDLQVISDIFKLMRKELCLNSNISQNEDKTQQGMQYEFRKKTIQLISIDAADVRHGVLRKKVKEVLTKNPYAKLYVMASMQSIGNGLNIQYKPNKDTVQIDILGKLSEDLEVDFDFIHFGVPTHLSSITANRYTSPAERLLAGYEAIMLKNRGEISYYQLNHNYLDQHILVEGDAPLSGEDLQRIQNSPSVKAKATAIIEQCLGRMTRSSKVKNRHIHIMADDETLTRLSQKELAKKQDIATPEMKALYQLMSQNSNSVQTETALENRRIQNNMLQAANRSENSVQKILNGLFQRNESKYEHLRFVEMWKAIRQGFLKYGIVTSYKKIDNRPVLSSLFYTETEQDHYYFLRQVNNQGRDLTKRICFDKKELAKEKAQLNKRDPDVHLTSGNVCSESARLSQLLKVKNANGETFEEHFRKKGFSITGNTYNELDGKMMILTPAGFNDIYKGAIGEEALQFFLEPLFIQWSRHHDAKIEGIDDLDYFEYFDFTLTGFGSEKIYLDAKNWHRDIVKMLSASPKHSAHIFDKLSQIPGAHYAFIINILQTDNVQECVMRKWVQDSMTVYIVPYIINKNGEVDQKIKEQLLKELMGIEKRETS